MVHFHALAGHVHACGSIWEYVHSNRIRVNQLSSAKTTHSAHVIGQFVSYVLGSARPVSKPVIQLPIACTSLAEH